MVRCPNCGQATSGDYCQYCKHPILRDSQTQRVMRTTVGIIFASLSLPALIVAIVTLTMSFTTNTITAKGLIVGLSSLGAGSLFLWISSKFLRSD